MGMETLRVLQPEDEPTHPLDQWELAFPEVLRCWPELSTEAKHLASYLWAACGHRPSSTSLCFAEICKLWGRTEGRARKWFAELVKHELVERDQHKRGPGGHVSIYVRDPYDVYERRFGNV